MGSQICLERISVPKQRELVTFMREVPGSIVILHSSLLPIGIPEGGLSNLWAEIRKALGPARTIVMPAFTFFESKEIPWDWHKSKSDVGALTEYFRSRVARFRTLHPIHSVAIDGPEASRLSSLFSSSSFGKGSIWDELCRRDDVWNVSLGIGFVGGATFIHYVEEEAQVPYREHVAIRRVVLDKSGKSIDGPFRYFARRSRNGEEADNFWDGIRTDLEREKLLDNRMIDGRIPITIMHVQPTCGYVRNRLKADPYYFGGFKLPT